MKTKLIFSLLFTVVLTGCAVAESKQDKSLPVVYNLHFLNIPNDGEFKHPYGEDQPKGQKIRKFAVSHSAKLHDTNTAYVSVQLIPFVHAQTCSRPLDLRLEQAKLGAFINYVAEGKVQFLPDKRGLIPLESIEQNLSALCEEIGIKRVTISRGMGWKKKESHNIRLNPISGSSIKLPEKD
jgi:hypothetical protein